MWVLYVYTVVLCIYGIVLKKIVTSYLSYLAIMGLWTFSTLGALHFTRICDTTVISHCHTCAHQVAVVCIEHDNYTWPDGINHLHVILHAMRIRAIKCVSHMSCMSLISYTGATQRAYNMYYVKLSQCHKPQQMTPFRDWKPERTPHPQKCRRVCFHTTHSPESNHFMTLWH